MLDKLNCSFLSSADQKLLCSLRTDFSLVDVWRKQNTRNVEFTWSNSSHTQASRIDRFFLAKNLVSQVFSCEIIPCTFSDHDFVKIGISTSGRSNRGSGVWRFNNSLLSDVSFRDFLSEAITKLKLRTSEFASLREWWDGLKIEIRELCTTFSVRKHKAANAKRIFLQNSLFARRMLCI